MRIRLFWLGAAAALSGLLAACGNSGTGPPAGRDFARMRADYVLAGLTHYLTDDGVRQGVLYADSAYFYADSARADLTKVHLVLYQSGGQPAADLTSKTGTLNQRTNAMVARGNVVLVAKNGDQRIETQELHFDPNQHRIWSDSVSTIYQNGNRTVTNGFTADDQLKNIQMKGVRSTVQAGKVTF